MARKLTFDELLAKREQREADRLKIGLLAVPAAGAAWRPACQGTRWCWTCSGSWSRRTTAGSPSSAAITPFCLLPQLWAAG